MCMPHATCTVVEGQVCGGRGAQAYFTRDSAHGLCLIGDDPLRGGMTSCAGFYICFVLLLRSCASTSACRRKNSSVCRHLCTLLTVGCILGLGWPPTNALTVVVCADLAHPPYGARGSMAFGCAMCWANMPLARENLCITCSEM
jgi:hypothetical protein